MRTTIRNHLLIFTAGVEQSIPANKDRVALILSRPEAGVVRLNFGESATGGNGLPISGSFFTIVLTFEAIGTALRQELRIVSSVDTVLNLMEVTLDRRTLEDTTEFDDG